MTFRTRQAFALALLLGASLLVTACSGSRGLLPAGGGSGPAAGTLNDLLLASHLAIPGCNPNAHCQSIGFTKSGLSQFKALKPTAHVMAFSSGMGPTGYGPKDLQMAYGVSPTGGLYRTVAVIEWGEQNNLLDALNQYRAGYGLSPCTKANGCFRIVDMNGGTNLPTEEDNAQLEADLDVDMVSANCPNCSILVVDIPTSADNFKWLELVGIAVDTAVNLGANAVSISGLVNGLPNGVSDAETLVGHFKHPGVTITASSGDAPHDPTVPLGLPAAYPNVVAVGGTSLTSDAIYSTVIPGYHTARGFTETWDSDGASAGCAVSYYSMPSFQVQAGSPCAKYPSYAPANARSIPDISYQSAFVLQYGVANGASVYYEPPNSPGWWTQAGGTSEGAPAIAAIAANIGTKSQMPDAIYSAYATNPKEYWDITDGKINSCAGLYPWCEAGTGFDIPTGVGTPQNVSW